MSDQAAAAASGMNFASLMELASLDTSDMTAQISRLAREGVYICQLTELKFIEQPAKDPAKPMNYALSIKGLILAFEPTVKQGEVAAPIPEGLIGGNLNERFFLFGENLKEAVQLLMGRFKQAGFRHKGKMGGIEGAEAGWIEEALNQRVAIRVRHGNRDGQDVAYFDWMSPKQMDKAGLKDWTGIMAREFLDENGKPIDPMADDKKKAA